MFVLWLCLSKKPNLPLYLENINLQCTNEDIHQWSRAWDNNRLLWAIRPETGTK